MPSARCESLTIRNMDDSKNNTVISGPQIAPAAIELPRRSTGGAWLRDLLLSVGVSAFIIIFLYQPVRVEGTSMLPQLEDQDRLFINKFAFEIGDIERGD